MSSGLELSEIYAKLPIALKNLTLGHLEPERNCSVAGNIASQISYIIDQETLMTAVPSVSDLLSFLHTCSNTTLGKLSPGDAVNWYIYQRDSYPGALDELWWEIASTSSACKESYCRHYEWEGDPDLAGIGVSSSFFIFFLATFRNKQSSVLPTDPSLSQVVCTYTIQAVIATFIILLQLSASLLSMLHSRAPARFNRFVSSAEGITSYRNALDTFVKFFWITSLYFALAMAITANLAISPTMFKYAMHPPPWFLVIGVHFATMVLICLWPWYGRQAKFPKTALLGVALLWVTVYCENGIFAFLPSNELFDVVCYSIDPPWFLSWEAFYFSQLVFPLGPAYHVTRCVHSWYCFVVGKKYTQWGWHAAAERVVNVVIPAVAFLSMWMDLIVFIELRIQAHRYIGQTSMEDKWTYGQILTVTTWLSVLVEFLRMGYCKSSGPGVSDLLRAILPKRRRK